MRPNGHDLRQITHIDGDAVRPDWSPDGRRIAFELDTQDSGSVAIMNADGSAMVVLPPAPGGAEGDPSFTPDGNRIVFERFVPDTNDDAIWSMNVDGTDRQRLGSGPIGATDPNVSPDGRALSFVSSNGIDSGALLTSRIDGSQQLQLTPFSFDVGVKQDWAPDGRHLAFIHDADLPNPGDSANIATIRPDGTDLRFLTHYQGRRVERVCRLLLARRTLDRLPPRGPRPLRALQDAPRRQPPQADPRPVELRAPIHRLGPACHRMLTTPAHRGAPPRSGGGTSPASG